MFIVHAGEERQRDEDRADDREQLDRVVGAVRDLQASVSARPLEISRYVSIRSMIWTQ